MSQELNALLEQAIQQSRAWETEGFPMRFGPYQVEVASLASACQLPTQFHNRQEALSFWQNIAIASREAVQYGEQARAAMQRGDWRAAHNAAYAAKYIERRFRESTPTWLMVCEAIAKKIA